MHVRVSVLLFCMIASIATAMAQDSVPLWDSPAPQSHGSLSTDIPEFAVFLPDKSDHPTSAVIICPGGAYSSLHWEIEGINEARWFQHHGVAGLALKYRLPANGYLHPIPLLDAKRAIRLIRNRATEWNIDPAKVGIMGFSAGGHLASTLETHFDSGNPQATDPVEKQNCRPNFAVLVYSVISMQDDITHPPSKKNLLGPKPDPALVQSLSNETQVTAQTPPTLLVHAEDDKTISIENSVLMYEALKKAGVPSDFQKYPKGGHSFGLGNYPDRSPAKWMDKVGDWLKTQGFMP